MNILFTESSRNYGGQELQAITQMLALKKMGHTVLLMCKSDSKIAVHAKKKGLEVRHNTFRSSLHIPSIYRLIQFIHHFAPDIIVCHSGHDSNTVGIARILSLYRQKPIYIIRQKTYLTRRIKTFSLNYLNDSIIVPGKAIGDSLIQAGCHSNKISVIPPGFDFDQLDEEADLPLPTPIQSWLNRNRDVAVILQVGMLRAEKSHGFMLQTLARLKSEGKKFIYLMAGGGKPCMEEIIRKQIIELDLQDRVFMAGSIFPVAPLYRIASLVVMPSRCEPFGMVVAEASAFAVPVLASHTGGIPDIICHNETGTLLPVEDVEAWLEALSDFLVNPERYRDMAKKACSDVRKRFDIMSTARNITIPFT